MLFVDDQCVKRERSGVMRETRKHAIADGLAIFGCMKRFEDRAFEHQGIPQICEGGVDC
jgi:hypothetical protein